MGRNFKEKVLAIVAGIPKGETLSYQQVAEKAGNERGARAVGSILAQNYNPKIPCHRVVGSNGRIGGYNRGVNYKRRLLEKEGAV